MTNSPVEMTVAELERTLALRQGNLDTLLRRRARIVKDLETTEARIKEIAGAGARNLKPRPKNPKSLHTVVTDLLTKRKSGYALHDLAEKVLSTGYKTHSADFKNVLYQCLYNSESFSYDEKTATYKLAPPPKTAKPKPKTKKK